MDLDDQAEREIQNFMQPEDAGICRSIGFIESLWGQTTRDLIWSTKRLKPNDWADITKRCAPHIRLLGCAKDVRFESEEDGPNGGCQRSAVHAVVEIDW
jgi:hypothetical protein